MNLRSVVLNNLCTPGTAFSKDIDLKTLVSGYVISQIMVAVVVCA